MNKQIENKQANEAHISPSVLNAGLAVVYGGNENIFFSAGIKRDFGQNVVIKFLDGRSIFFQRDAAKM